MTYHITIDNSLVDEYADYYFQQHPRAHKKPIKRPIHPSINQWMILPRMQMNALKQKHKDFIIWVINKLGYSNLKLEHFNMTIITYMPTKRRIDPDNTSIKFWNDGFTESGFIVDDDGEHLHSLTLMTGHDKDNPRTEIVVETIE